MIISVHIPKCGGISFQHVLLGLYGRKRVWLNYGAAFTQDQARADLIPPGTRCIHGHFLSDTFDRLALDPIQITWMRHPVERVVSHYFHFLRHPDWTNPVCRELLEKRLTLEEFAELPRSCNVATQFMAGKPLDAFSFVGITERFRESLEVFGRRFEFAVARKLPLENCNPDRPGSRYAIPSETRERILSLNLADWSAYQTAEAQLDRSLGQFRPQAA